MRSLCALLMGYKLSSMEIPAGGKKTTGLTKMAETEARVR